jgi:pilus assembly protein CpaB
MRRGGRLLLVLGILIAAVAAGLLFVVLNNAGSGVTTPPGEVSQLPTPDPGVDVVIAQVDIPANQVISDTALLSTVNIPTDEYNANRAQYFTSITEVVGQLTINPIPNGQRIEQRDLTEPGLSQQIPPAEEGRPADKAIAFRVDALTGVADQVKPGDTVDVVATFRIPRRIVVPGGLTSDGQGGQTETVTYETIELLSSKTIVQRAQVLKIVRPAAPQETQEGQGGQPQPTPTVEIGPDGQPVGGGAPAAPGQQGNAITPGQWLLVLAVNNQEAELIEYARASDSRISLVLRGAGDNGFEQTIGASLDLLISEFGVPLPQPESMFAYGRDALTPQPTRTPAPTRVP